MRQWGKILMLEIDRDVGIYQEEWLLKLAGRGI